MEEICESLDIRSKVDIRLDFATVERKTKEPAADVSRTSN